MTRNRQFRPARLSQGERCLYLLFAKRRSGVVCPPRLLHHDNLGKGLANIVFEVNNCAPQQNWREAMTAESAIDREVDSEGAASYGRLPDLLGYTLRRAQTALFRLVCEHENKFFEGFSTDERRVLMALLKRLCDAERLTSRSEAEPRR